MENRKQEQRMTNTEVIDRDDETIGEPMSSRPTRRDLAERGLDVLDPSKMASAKVSVSAGGVTFASVVEVMDFAKAMATAGIMLAVDVLVLHFKLSNGACRHFKSRRNPMKLKSVLDLNRN
jgi:hypothetical protein